MIDIKPLGQGVQPLSAATAVLEMYAGDTCVGIGTGFAYRFRGKPYLITNWHNLTGRDPATGQPRTTDGVVPTTVKARLHPPPKRDERGTAISLTIGERAFNIPALGVDEHPWLMHKRGQMIDIVAAEFQEEFDIYCVNDGFLVEDPYVEVGQEVFLLGFPRGLQPTGLLPIWKRGSIATEPRMFSYSEPFILVDSATRERMSSALVVARAITKEDHAFIIGEDMGKKPIIFHKNFALIGIYSGRMGHSDLLEAQLGKVWIWPCIDALLADPQPADWEPLGEAPHA